MPSPRADDRFVYFARCQAFIKIGVAADVYSRIKVLGTAAPWPVDLAAQLAGTETQERLLHGLFSDLHHRNEWFWERGLLADLVQLLSTAADARSARVAANDWYYERAPGSAKAKAAFGGDRYWMFMRERRNDLGNSAQVRLLEILQK